jgi:hypothetical protein
MTLRLRPMAQVQASVQPAQQEPAAHKSRKGGKGKLVQPVQEGQHMHGAAAAAGAVAGAGDATGDLGAGAATGDLGVAGDGAAPKQWQQLVEQLQQAQEREAILSSALVAAEQEAQQQQQLAAAHAAALAEERRGALQQDGPNAAELRATVAALEAQVQQQQQQLAALQQPNTAEGVHMQQQAELAPQLMTQLVKMQEALAAAHSMHVQMFGGLVTPEPTAQAGTTGGAGPSRQQHEEQRLQEEVARLHREESRREMEVGAILKVSRGVCRCLFTWTLC